MDIQPKVTHRCCPECGYLVTQLEIDLAVDDFPCPRGCDFTFRKFQPLNIEHKPDESK